MVQESIAAMLGVRRVGITEAAHKLQAAALIGYRRGRISVLDRQAWKIDPASATASSESSTPD